MIRRLLIANRGEIACRIIRTCQQMGITSIAVFSDADKNGLWVQQADEAVHIGASQPAASYLNAAAIIDAAKRTDADAIHPGYGFLSENADFARAVTEAGLIFVGPSADAIADMGDKALAKSKLGNVPFVPGYAGDDQTNSRLMSEAEKIGYPLMIKATAGGGGKGMRLVTDAANLADALDAARRESAQAFGSDSLMLEKALTHPRHVEVQILGDEHGTVIALGERECSIQRRHQKIIEEAPSPALTPELRALICQTAVSIAQQIDYTNAGTVEFLLDEAGEFYFIEMNTRLQVEHPVTEAVYGIDLVQLQIAVAEGARLADLLPGAQPDQYPALPANGHAIEVRLYAEEPANDFLPATGDILKWHAPPLVRVDTAMQSGDKITTFYDPMIAKIIAHGQSRTQAIRRLDYALAQTVLLGTGNNLAYLRRILNNPQFQAGDTHTAFIDEHPELLQSAVNVSPSLFIAAALVKQDVRGFWRNNMNRPIRHRFESGEKLATVDLAPQPDHTLRATVDEASFTVDITGSENDTLTLLIDGHRLRYVYAVTGANIWLHSQGQAHKLRWIDPLPRTQQRTVAAGSLHAPMPGQVLQVNVHEGQSVTAGELLIIVEAMKMEHRITAPDDGIISKLYYEQGDTVDADVVLLELSPLDADEQS